MVDVIKTKASDPSNWRLSARFLPPKDSKWYVASMIRAYHSSRLPVVLDLRPRATAINPRLAWAGLSMIALCSGGCSAQGKLSLSGASAKAGADQIEVRKGGGDRSTRLSRLRVEEAVCREDDLTPEKNPLTISDLKKYFTSRSIPFSVNPERDDLHLFDVEVDGEKAQLRVATLGSAHEAGRHLHQALLEHGKGYWGVHRGNLAILAPSGSPEEGIGFASKSGLLCWGVYTQAGRDDSFAVPGGYFEL